MLVTHLCAALWRHHGDTVTLNCKQGGLEDLTAT
jgi:hypothetical protein